jgi:hypothetical protein
MKILLGVLMGVAAFAQEPQFTKDNRLMKPENYREWIYLSSGIGMTYGPARESGGENPPFENVFVNPTAYKAFIETGKWPNGTTFILEIRASASQGSINKGGHFQQERLRYEVEVKDERLADKWAFFGFGESDASAQPIPKTAGCQACHSKNGAVENTFVQFYPTLLPIAKAKGTLKPIPESH